MAPAVDVCLGLSCVSLPVRGSFGMKKLAVLCVALCVSLSPTAAFARGGGGSHHSSATGGAAGTSPAAPGTNSAGTALSSGGGANGPQKGPLVGTNCQSAFKFWTPIPRLRGSILQAE